MLFTPGFPPPSACYYHKLETTAAEDAIHEKMSAQVDVMLYSLSNQTKPQFFLNLRGKCTLKLAAVSQNCLTQATWPVSNVLQLEHTRLSLHSYCNRCAPMYTKEIADWAFKGLATETYWLSKTAVLIVFKKKNC